MSNVAELLEEPKESGSLSLVREFFEGLECRGVEYCHWKSNCRLREALQGSEDIDLLVNPRDAIALDGVLAESGFKRIRSRRQGLEHPGVFHALALDDESAVLVHLHVYFQIVTGDSLAKSYVFPMEQCLLGDTRRLSGVKVPLPKAELLVFALRMALKHVSPIEIWMVNRHYDEAVKELAWLLGDNHAAQDAEALLPIWCPSIDSGLFRELLQALGRPEALAQRVVLGWRVAWRLRHLRRLGTFNSMRSRVWRVLLLAIGRLAKRKSFTLVSGGAIVAVVGPKATGKSTIVRELETRIGNLLAVSRIHAGKPPSTWLSLMPNLVLPLGRALFPGEKSAEYDRPGKAERTGYSMLHVLRQALLAYDRRRLLFRAARDAATGTIVVSDRFPSATIGAKDSSTFGSAVRSGVKGWLMTAEHKLYSGLPRPRLVLRLEAPIDVAIERDASRDKKDGPDPQALRRRRDLEARGQFPGAQVVPIDTDRPLDDTIRIVLRAVWSGL